MRFVTVALAALLVAAAGCAGTPLVDRLPDDAFDRVGEARVIEAWPRVARRPYGGDMPGGMPPRFHERTMLRGLALPTSFVFTPDGGILVAEQSGLVKAFDGPYDTEPAIVLDIRQRVYASNLMGLLGIALDPDFAQQPYLYVAYTHDAPIGGTAPTYGGTEGTNDDCPVERRRCVVSGRIARFELDAAGLAGEEHVLIEDWCHDGVHSLGTVAFGRDGALYAGAGDATGAFVVEYGHQSVPPNACGDPPGAVGEMPSPPSAEGGALRSQDLRTPDDPLGLHGTIIRVDRATGLGLADNPLAGAADLNARRVVAYGLRNPFRFVFRPGTDEIWIADVGWNSYEELNVLTSPAQGPVPNYGWPCYEGAYRQPEYEATGLDICRELYAEPDAVRAPLLSLAHGEEGDEGECEAAADALSGIAFYDGASFPPEFHGALFVADSARGCVWVVHAGADRLPDLNTIRQFARGHRPVDMKVGPDGGLYLLDNGAGTLRRIQYYAAGQPPLARVRGTSTGPAPLSVTLDASHSSDADGEELTFAWDTDRDGDYDDGSGPTLSITIDEPGTHPIYLRVTDASGEWSERTYTLSVSPPAP